jgi:hypothetical protein
MQYPVVPALTLMGGGVVSWTSTLIYCSFNLPDRREL